MGDNGVTTEGSGNAITVSGVNATAAATVGAATIGVASFDSSNFTVTDGFVTLNSTPSSLTVTTDAGSAAPDENVLAIDGVTAQGVATSGSGNQVLITVSNATNASKGVARFSADNFSVSSGTVEIAADGIDGTEILLANDQYLRGRNAADSADVNIIRVDSNDSTQIGTNVLNIDASGTVQMEIITSTANLAMFRAYSAAGDSFVGFNDTSANVGYAFGTDGDDSANLKLTTGTISGNPSTGTELFLHDNGSNFFQFNDQVRLDANKALRLYDSDSSNFIGLKSAATVSSDVTYTLPEDGDSGDVLTTEGGGILSFVKPAAILPTLYLQMNSTFAGDTTMPVIQFMNDTEDTFFTYPGGFVSSGLQVAGGLGQSDNLTGTISSSGTAVTGSGTQFLTDFQVGDVIYSVTDATARRITTVADDTNILVESSWTITGGTNFRRGGRAPYTAYLTYAIWNGTLLNVYAHTRNVYAGDVFPAADLPSGYTIQRQLPRFFPTENASTAFAGNHCAHGQILFNRSGTWNNPSITEFLTAGTAGSPSEVEIPIIPAGCKNAWLGWSITNSASASTFQIRISTAGTDQSAEITGVTGDVGVVLVRLNTSGNIYYWRASGSGELTLNVNAVFTGDFHMPT